MSKILLEKGNKIYFYEWMGEWLEPEDQVGRGGERGVHGREYRQIKLKLRGIRVWMETLF